MKNILIIFLTIILVPLFIIAFIIGFIINVGIFIVNKYLELKLKRGPMGPSGPTGPMGTTSPNYIPCESCGMVHQWEWEHEKNK